MQHLPGNWQFHYLPLMGVSVLLALALRQVTRAMVLFTVQALLLFVLLMLGSTIASAVGSAQVARPLQGLAVVLLGILLIRQLALIFFRLVLPRLGMQPPRILEELMILLASIGWILIRLSAAGLDLGNLVTSTAVITAVLAFAMQDTLGNILSGLALQLDRSVNIGDWIELDTIGGEVLQVQWRHTAVRTLLGERVLIPNSQLMKARVMLTGGPSVPQRVQFVEFYCDFDTRPTDVITAVEAALADAEFDTVAKSPHPICLVRGFSNGLVTYAVRYWLTRPSAPGQTDSLVRQHIHAVFQREGWRMAAPGMAINVVPRRNRNTASHDIERRVRALRAISLFDPLTDDELRDVAARLKTVHYVAGSVLARQNQAGDCLFVVQSGQAAVWLEVQGGRHRLAEVGPGEVIGEMSLMTGEPRRATVTALTHLTCYVLSNADFQFTLRQRPELAEIFAQLLSTRRQEIASLKDNLPAKPPTEENADILARIRSLFRL